MVAPFFSADMFRLALLRLLPRGPIWSRDPDGLPSRLAAIWGKSFARNSQRAATLLVDAFPSTTQELLPEWEASLGLPDPCAGESPTIGQRRAQVVARLTDSGGYSIAYYVNFAKTLGYDISIQEFERSYFGRKFGQKFGGRDWAYTWQVSVPQFTVFRNKFGSVFGEPFASWGAVVVQCEFLGRKPAHTILNFTYGSGDKSSPLSQFVLDVNTLT